MRIVSISVIMMLAGLATLFGMVIGLFTPALLLALLAYAATFVGLLLGTFALAQRARRPGG